MGLAVAQVAWRRANQLGDFVRVLELRAIDLDHRASVSKQDFRGRFHDARLPGPRRPKKKEVPYRAARRIQPGAKNLVQIDQRLDALFLSDNLLPQRRLEINRVRAAFAGVEWQDSFAHDRLLVRPRCRAHVAESPAYTAKLVELNLNGGMQEPHLYKQFPCHHGGFRNSEERRNDVR